MAVKKDTTEEQAVSEFAVFTFRNVVVTVPVAFQSTPARTIQIARSVLHEIADRAEVELHVAE